MNDGEPLAVQYEDLRYIKTRSETDKRAKETWGGYSQDYDAADNVYSHDEVVASDDTNWGIVGIDNPEHMERSLLIFDLDVHKAEDADSTPEAVTLPDDTLVTKSQNGGFHVYFAVTRERGELSESDFSFAAGLDAHLTWEFDTRGSAVNHHVVAPSDIPGVGGEYEIVNDAPIRGVFDPRDAAEQLRIDIPDESNADDTPLLAYNASTGVGDIDFDRDAEPPEAMPRCYYRGLLLRAQNPDDHPNTHKVNTLTALCGLAAGYDVNTMVEHFCDEFAPGNSADQEETRYQLEHMAKKMEGGSLAPPAVSTLREWGFLDDNETCSCDIEYHGRGESQSPVAENATRAEEWGIADRDYVGSDGVSGRAVDLPSAPSDFVWAELDDGRAGWMYHDTVVDDEGREHHLFDQVLNADLELRAVVEHPEKETRDTEWKLTIKPTNGAPEREVVVSPAALNDTRAFKEEIIGASGATVYNHRGRSMDSLNALKLIVHSQDAPERYAYDRIKVITPDDSPADIETPRLVTPIGTLSPDGWVDDPTHVWHDGKTGEVAQKWSLDPDDISNPDTGEARRVAEKVLRTRDADEERLHALFGHMFAALFRPIVKGRRGTGVDTWTHAKVSGDTGSGKTALAKMVWHVLGLSKELMKSNKTPGGLLNNFAATNAIPLAMDEYTPDSWEKTRRASTLHQYLKDATDGSTEEKYVNYPEMETWEIDSTAVVIGEQTYPDGEPGPALARRSVHISLANAPDSNDDEAERFSDVMSAVDEENRYAAHHHALALWKWVLAESGNPRALVGEWRAAEARAKEVGEDYDVDHDMWTRGAATVAFGLEQYRRFAVEVLGADAEKLPSDDDIDAAVEYVYDGHTGDNSAKTSDKDQFVELFAEAASVVQDSEQQYLVRGEDYALVHTDTSTPTEIRIHLRSAISGISQYIRDHGLRHDVRSKSDYHQWMSQAAENPDSYVETAGQNTPLAAGTRKCIGLRLGRVIQALDVAPLDLDPVNPESIVDAIQADIGGGVDGDDDNGPGGDGDGGGDGDEGIDGTDSGAADTEQNEPTGQVSIEDAAGAGQDPARADGGTEASSTDDRPAQHAIVRAIMQQARKHPDGITDAALYGDVVAKTGDIDGDRFDRILTRLIEEKGKLKRDIKGSNTVRPVQ